MKQAVTWLLIVCLIPCLTGCDTFRDTNTGQLWDDDTALDHYAPATNANVRMFQGTYHHRIDVLVEYNEEREKDGVIRRRAYFVLANEKRVGARRKPHFVSLALAAKMEPIPVETEDVKTNSIAVVWAKLSPDGQNFTVYQNGVELGTYQFPMYASSAGTTIKRLLLTPATVTVDVAIAVAVVAVVAGAIYLSAYADSH